MSEDLKEQSAPAKSQEDIIALAKSRWKIAEDGWQEVHEAALDDQKFVAGEQWPDGVKAARSADGRPTLTINRMPQFVRQITNEQRQNRPTIKISPVDSGADKDNARIIQGLIKNIWNNSNADIAIDTAFEGAVEKSFGYFRLIADYCAPDSFDQEILIKQIPNHFSVRIDPNFKEPDGSDIGWGFILEEMSKDEFKQQYPEAELSQMNDWSGVGHADDWIKKESCKVLEYFTKEYEPVELVQFSNGVVLERDKVPDKLPDGVKEVKSRESTKTVVKWYKINGLEVLEDSEFPGRFIPIFPVFGAIKIVDGKRIIESAIRHSKDSQIVLNYMVSAESEAIALAPKAPFMVAVGQIPEGHKKAWATANTKSHAYLTYSHLDENGKFVGAPQRNSYEPNVQAITNARLQASDDMKATTGIYDASLGKQSNETSGIAIQRRNMQSQTSNFHLQDNLSRSIRHLGKVLLDIIPKYYDTARTIRIIGPDDKEEIVKINEFFNENGEDKKIHFSGKYDAVVEVGPSYGTKREEAAASMMELLKVMPQQAPAFADLILRNMDFPGSDDVANRMKKMVPPNLLEDKDKPQGQSPEEMQAQIQQMSQMIEQIQAQNQQQAQLINTKKMELDSKEKIELAKLDVEMAIAQQKITHEVDMNVFTHSVDMLHKRLDTLGFSSGIDEPEIQPDPQIDNQSFNESGNEAVIPTNEEM